MSNRTSSHNNTYIPYLIIGVCFIIILFINSAVCYPTDNDLDEVGWLADNLTFTRLESFANMNYPFGLPVLLYFLTPIFGSLLRAALICEAIACAFVMLFAYRISMRLYCDYKTAILTLILVAILIFHSATSEFADGITTALLFAGFYILLSRNYTKKAYLLFGVLIGFAYLFRFHYLTFLIFIPAASFVLCGSIKNKSQNIIFFILGFIIGSLPLLVINSIVYGTPIATGYSQYTIGFHVMHAVDFNNFLETYAVWPLSRLILEQPMALIKHMIGNVFIVFSLKYIASGVLLIPLSIITCKKRGSKHFSLLLVVIAILYSACIILPVKYADRDFLPVAIIVLILIAPSLTFIGEKITNLKKAYWIQAIYLFIVIVSISHLPSKFHYIKDKYQAQSYNRIILKTLRAAGMKQSSEVFCNEWNMYPLDDPKFQTFYNYGGWLLLDSKYAAERPMPTATTVKEWRQFMISHKLKYMVITKTQVVEPLFADTLPAEWERIYWDGRYLILSLRSQSP